MSQKFCTQCGEKLPENGNFCPQCGAAVESAETSVVAPKASAPPPSAAPVPLEPAAQLDAELATQDAPSGRPASEQTSGGSRTLIYALGGVAAIVALLAVVYFAFLQPDGSGTSAAADLSDCGEEPCTIEAVTAGAPNDAVQAQNAEDIPYPEIARISVDEAHISLAEGSAIVVDVRDRDSYTNMHIPGALSIPLDEVEARMGELPREAEILTYCT
jgi:hypothetical protein